MKRFISNYTILTSGKEYINHITTITDDNKLLSIEPFDRELGNTRYVPTPLCVTTSDHYNKVKEAFHASSSRQQFKQCLEGLKKHDAQEGNIVIILNLDFSSKTITQL